MFIKNKHPHYSNAKVILPHIGEVTLKDGTVEVSDELGEMLITTDQWVNLSAAEESINPKAKSSKKAAKIAEEVEEDEFEDIELGAEEVGQLIEMAKTMTHEELLSTATQAKMKGAGLPVFQNPDKVENLRKFVIKNLTKLMPNE